MDCLRCFYKDNNEEINDKSDDKSDEKIHEKSDEKSDDKIDDKIDDKSDDKSDDKIDVDTSIILDDIVVIETDKSELNSPIILNETYCK